MRVEIAGAHFTTYHQAAGEWTKPYCFPVYGAAGKRMTRVYPLGDALPDEEKDHRHHTGLWFAHGDVNGVDLWHGQGAKGGRIVQTKMSMRSGAVGELRTENRYEDNAGKYLCSETRVLRFFATEHGRFLDFDVTIHADRGPVVLGDTKEGTMAIRLPATLRLEGPVARGRSLTSAGIRGAEAWGKRAAWADYHGPVDGETVGVALFDHPSNPVHPTRWMIRAYGLFTANPFGLHHFEKKPPGTGDVPIPAGASRTFRYRFFFHHGSPEAAGVAAEYARFAGSKP